MLSIKSKKSIKILKRNHLKMEKTKAMLHRQINMQINIILYICYLTVLLHFKSMMVFFE